ncbi:hypothetical protein KP803_20880 [Vibrio sp. ZSDE26]|uniref:Uncharacterized protein n=1 Tax=Vibrio amylolyticus TaxID=2847292 RepID=A0A9X2BLK1_9VIBR|nr:hypothetical protein [Vibrio amylolyticus]MCK6265717.1 hypothetical protein [Vibrio amylolyticus]
MHQSSSLNDIEAALGQPADALGKEAVRNDFSNPFENGLEFPTPEIGNDMHRPPHGSQHNSVGLTTGGQEERLTPTLPLSDPDVTTTPLEGLNRSD